MCALPRVVRWGERLYLRTYREQHYDKRCGTLPTGHRLPELRWVWIIMSRCGSVSRLHATRQKALPTRTVTIGCIFELRDDELQDNGNDASASSFYLIFDLSSLSEEKYIMPKDIKADNKDQSCLLLWQSSLREGKFYSHNLYVPLKRWIDVKVMAVNWRLS